MKRLVIGAAAALGAACAMAAPASAQVSGQGGPIEISADNLEALTNDGRYIWTGNVDAIQANSRLRTTKLTMNCDRGQVPANATAAERAGQACREIRNFVAEGQVFYITPDERMRADRAEYDYTSDVITLTGDVILTRGDEGAIRGRRLVYEVSAGRATMTGDPAASGGSGRVIGQFSTSPRSTASATPAPAATPAPTPTAPPSNR